MKVRVAGSKPSFEARTPRRMTPASSDVRVKVHGRLILLNLLLEFVDIVLHLQQGGCIVALTVPDAVSNILS